MIEDDADRRADWPLLKDGAVTLFWRTSLFEQAKASLTSLSYALASIECISVEQFAADLGGALGWEQQFGYSPWSGNLNALAEGAATVAFPPSLCLALAFEGYHRLVAQDAEFAHGVLDVIEYQARNHLAAGRRLIVLVQTDEAHFVADNLGARRAMWNRAEWLDGGRR
ncbi:hypothetical protein [Phenylobacterium aquaticum]|uniref:hypothetical protein n=1 Tax=Phenylobacterium aquaticum TaxID=1763816 RepID=UPI001F5CB41F|nr:hypothetical protein [Phenylobacterium aquaticum]MCI3132633.1 hypothetical protein [Phenylobacterium aquaticum]